MVTTDSHYIIKGKKHVRVTTFLERVGVSDFSKIPDREFYMARGKANHELFEHVERGIDSEHTYDPRVEVYRGGHARFLKETGFKALPGGIELFVSATWKDFGFSHSGEEVGIAGTMDRIGTIQDRVVLLDFKTSQIPSSTSIQTSLYLLMIPGYKFNEVDRYGVAIKNDGKYSMSQKYGYSDKSETIGLVGKYLKSQK